MTAVTFTPEMIAVAVRMRAQGQPWATIAQRLGVDDGTLRRFRMRQPVLFGDFGQRLQRRDYWAPAKKARLRELWSDGWTVRQIAADIRVTPNAVVGKRKRMKLPARRNPVRRSAVCAASGVALTS